MMLLGYKTKMSNPNPETNSDLQTTLQDRMVDALQGAREARAHSDAHYNLARDHASAAEHLSAMPNVAQDEQDDAISRHAEHWILGAQHDHAADQHEKEADAVALQLGEHVVRHEVVPPAPEYDPRDAVSVIDLR